MTTPTTTDLHIRWMIHRDLAQVTAIDSIWGDVDFLRVLRHRNNIGMVAEAQHGDDTVLGYMLYEVHREHINLLRFAVLPSRRREGIGGQMLGKLAGKLSATRRKYITTSVADDNLPAQCFLRSCGYWCGGIHGEEYRFRLRYDPSC